MALSTYENAQEYRQQHLFTKLLSCHAELSEEEQKLLDAAPIMHGVYTHVMAIGLWYPSAQTPQISRDLLEELFEKNPGYPYLFLAPFAEAQFVFLLTGQKSPAAMYHYARSCIQKDFFKQEGLIVTLSEAHIWEGNFSRPFTDCALTYSLHLPRYASGIFLYSDTFTKDAPDGGKERFLKTYFSSPMEKKQILPMLKDFLQYFIADQSVYDLEFMKLQFIRLVDTWVESLRSYHLHDYLEQDALSAQKSFSAKRYLHQIFEAAYYLFVNITDSLEQAAQVPSKQLIRNSLTYIRENFGQNITLVDLARNLYVSPAYLSKVFSTEIGQPFSKYLQEYRVNKAIEYLRDSQYKVYQIASICGFSDVAYFSKIFKSVTGMTPNQYRNTQVR